MNWTDSYVPGGKRYSSIQVGLSRREAPGIVSGREMFVVVVVVVVVPTVAQGAPHKYSFTSSFNCAGQTVPSLLSLACERFYHTGAVKPEEYRSVQFVIQMGAKHLHDVSSQ